MLSNKMLDLILEELKLEKDEEFEIKNVCYNHRINKNGLEYCFDDHWDSSIYLSELLSGELEIFKSPFVPENETYYVPDISIANLYRKIWNYGTKHDKHRIEHEMCFRTKQGAINKAKWLLNQNHQ
jgi:hypothetical protein